MSITINDTSPRVQYVATGSQTDFAGTWRIEEDTDIKVYQTPVGISPDDTTDILVLTTDYTVTGAGVGNSFTVVLNSGATTGDIITIINNIDFSAEYEFLTNQDFNPDDFNQIFSKFDRELKQLRMETRKLQPKYQNSSQVIAKDYPLPQLGAKQSWRMDDLNSEIEAVEIGDTGPGEQWYGVTTGVNTYLATITDFIGYTTGETIYLKFGSSNTAASTININSLGGKHLLRNDGTPLNSGDLVAGITYTFIYHSGQYYLLGIQRASEASTGISQIATSAEVDTGTDDFKYVTPKKLRLHTGNNFYVEAIGPANTYAGTLSGITAYYPGMILEVLINDTSTGASTFNLNGLGAQIILRSDGTAINSGDLQVNHVYLLIYTGGNFLLVSNQNSSESSSGIVRLATEAEVKAGTSLTTAISPGNFAKHPNSVNAWVSFNGTTMSVLDSYNLGSVVTTGAGLYTINWSISFDNINYCTLVSSASLPGSSNNSVSTTVLSQGASQVNIELSDSNGLNRNSNFVSVVSIGKLV